MGGGAGGVRWGGKGGERVGGVLARSLIGGCLSSRL